MFDFSEKRVLVTGGSRGIGLVIGRAFADAGAVVAINDVIPPEFDMNADNIKAFYEFDISDSSTVNHNINRLLEEFGRIDILVNNAGLTRDNLFMRMSEENWDQVINVNLKGTFNVTKALTRQFMKNRSGCIINITSVVGLTGNIGQANYVASKAGIIGLTKSLALEFAPRFVRVNAVAPGFIRTKMTDNLSDEVKDEYLRKVPLKSFGEPRDVASATLFLASDQARYITGQVISVNGGLFM